MFNIIQKYGSIWNQIFMVGRHWGYLKTLRFWAPPTWGEGCWEIRFFTPILLPTAI